MAQDAIGTLQTKAALRITERRAQLALDAAQDGVWDWDVPSGRITVNEAYFAMLGEGNAGGHLMIAEWQSRVHPHDQPKLQQRVEVLVKEATVMEAEYRLRHANGGWCWLRSRAEVVEPDVRGRARRIIGTHADITRLKEAKRDAVQAYNKLEAALASMSDAVFISDADGNLVHMNQAFATFHRFASLTECADRLEEYGDLVEVCCLDGTPVTLSQWALPRALRGESAVDQVYRLRRKDTGESWVGSYNLGPIRDADDRVTSAVVTARDMTDQKKAEQALRASEKRFRTLIDANPFPVVVTDAEHKKIIYWSKSAQDLFGHQPKTPAEWLSLAYPDPQYRQAIIDRSKPYLERAQHSKTAVNAGKYQIVCRDGSVKKTAVGRPPECVPRGVWQGTSRRNSRSIPTSCNAARRRAGRALGVVSPFTHEVSL